jgi:hypothetical protein
MPNGSPPPSRSWVSKALIGISAIAAIAILAVVLRPATPTVHPKQLHYLSRRPFDAGGFTLMLGRLDPWASGASLREISQAFDRIGYRQAEVLDRQLAKNPADGLRVPRLLAKAAFLNFEGEVEKSYQLLQQARAELAEDDALAEHWLYTVIYFQGVTALRRAENENCILCRGESSCIFPIVPAAVHTNPLGSRLAIKHFGEYLEQFPDDLAVRWLFNLAHMTLGEYPKQVDPRFVLNFDHYFQSEFDIGRFRDIGHLVGVNRFNHAGGAIMEDFDNDGLLDIVVTSFHPAEHMAFYRNKGDGTFEDRTKEAGLLDQCGALNCVQTDFNNDGFMDIFVIRGGWFPYPVRPSLLRNNGDGTFTDVTAEAGLLDPVNSIAAGWADYDNDGFLDLFICCEHQPNKLYHNKGDGTFEEVAAKAGVQGSGLTAKGCAWIDYDNDGYPDLFVNNLGGHAQLFHNNRDGTFTDVTKEMGINGPMTGFACWAFDYDNDGWLDIFATSYDRTFDDIVGGMLGKPHSRQSNRLFRNLQGKGFQDVTKEAGLDMVFATMGSNFGDFDNDGYLDIYLGTGDPDYATLVPNRMFKNVASPQLLTQGGRRANGGGRRFAEITASSGTGHLQKGHGVACGDWDRDGNVDIFIEMGGVTNGDKYHNVLFQNPGQGNNWLTIKLIGKKTNRAAIGARIKVVAAPVSQSGTGPGQEQVERLTVHRHISSGSSFGANPLQQTIGLGKADKVETLEIHWPTSGTTQVFRDIAVNQAIEITEFAESYRKLDWKPIPLPKQGGK